MRDASQIYIHSIWLAPKAGRESSSYPSVLEKLLPLDRVAFLVSRRVSFEIMLTESDASNNLVASAKYR